MLDINFPISQAEVYWCVVDFEGIGSQDISVITGLAKATVQKHLSALIKADAVKGQGRPKQYHLNSDVASEYVKWLNEFEEIARLTRGQRGRAFQILLFDTKWAAQEAALILQSLNAFWDGCNGVKVTKPEKDAIESAAEYLSATFCYGGDYCYTPLHKLDQISPVPEQHEGNPNVQANVNTCGKKVR